jgi:glycerol-3-phosphate dehydrogenase
MFLSGGQRPPCSVCFAVVWEDTGGHTETTFSGKPENTQPTEQEVRYLLDTVGEHFPQANLDIDAQFSGIRVLPASNERAFMRNRDVRLLEDEGLVSLYGGKLTAYRATAEKLLALVQEKIGKTTSKADTRNLRLHHPVEDKKIHCCRPLSVALPLRRVSAGNIFTIIGA